LSELVRELGGLDLLILSSGTGDLNAGLDFGIEKKTIDTNVIGFTEIIDWSYKYFQKQKYGHIVAISSIAGLRGSRHAPSYNATKAYQINYLEGIRQKAYKQKLSIYVTDVRPGFVDTDMAKGEGKFWVASQGKAANQIYSLIKRKKPVGYITKRWKILALILKLLPIWIYKRL
jgi:short-subunit dehydrogenase